MKSKVTFDFGENLQPIIRATIAYGTDDVRDKLARAFSDNLGYESNLCSIIPLTEIGTSDKIYQITPIRDPYQAVILEMCKLHPEREDAIVEFINSLHD